jgi:hypothetical protein
VAAASLAWANRRPGELQTNHLPTRSDRATTDSRASSDYETPTEAPALTRQLFPDVHHDPPPVPTPEPPGATARTTTNEQDYYVLHQQNPYQFPPVPAENHSSFAPAPPLPQEQLHEIPRKPVGSSVAGGDGVAQEHEHLTALPALPGQSQSHDVPVKRDSDRYTFYTEGTDDDYPYHAR